MTQPQWETVSLPQSTDLPPFLKWGDIAGQEVIGAVLDYTPDGGKDFDGNASPRVDILITQAGYNIKDGRQVALNPGDRVTWQGNTPTRLATGLKAAEPKRGDLIKLTHEGTYRTANGTGKDIQVRIARGEGEKHLQKWLRSVVVDAPTEEPPF